MNTNKRVKVKKVKQKKPKKPNKLEKAFQKAVVDTVEQFKKVFGIGGGVSSGNSSDTPETLENPPSNDEVK